MKVVQIPVSMITANPEQPRKVFKDEELEELTKSISEYGVLQPLIVKRAEGKRFILIAGERRLRAAVLAGLKTVPAVVKEIQDREAALIALVENVQRENLSFLEEARAYKKLMEDFGLTQGEISKRVSKQQSTISNKIRILSLPDDIQNAIMKNGLTERHARALLKLSNQEDRKKIVERVAANGLNVKQTEKLIEDMLASKEKAERNRRKINYISYKIYMNTIRKAFNQVKDVEKNARLIESDKGDFLEVKIIIPKNSRCFT
ncbi:MAG: ParB/RepB/Spo0J family partition protein [Firmicutes bacterium]|nr:ParB/RepB/Spo0J family partition protein [Bacillota bacterium]